MTKTNTAPRKKPHFLLRLLIKLTVIVLSAVALVLGISAIMIVGNQGHIYDTNDVPDEEVAIVFGAGLRPDNSPTPMLADRVETAVELYKQGKVQRLIMTGDESSQSHPEVTSMRDYAVKLGVPSNAIVLDQAGLHTYDSCWRAAHVFNVKKAILVSQGYHLPRAIYTCTSLGVEAVGVKAGGDGYRFQDLYNLREILARFGAVIDVITKPTPIDVSP